MRTLTCSPTVEGLGAPLLSFVENLNSDEILPYLKKYGLTEIDPDGWYPLQQWLNVLNDMAKETNLTSNLVAIGLEIFSNIKLPPELEKATLPEILMLWDNLYQMQHRGGDFGHVNVEKISDTHFKTIHTHVYPDDMVYGVAYGMARRFLPQGTDFTVFYDEGIPHLDSGGTETIIHIKW